MPQLLMGTEEQEKKRKKGKGKFPQRPMAYLDHCPVPQYELLLLKSKADRGEKRGKEKPQ